jgi:hypothetical protein
MKCVFFLAIASLLASEPFKITKEDGTSLTYYCDKPKEGPFSIALLIPGSQKETSLKIHNAIKQNLLESGRALVTLEKEGIEGETIDEKKFIQALSHETRLEDHHLLIKEVKKGLLEGWNGTFVIIGQGDGGRIGSSLAAKTEGVTALALIASGGAWSPRDEALFSFRKEMADEGYPPQYIHGFLVQAKQQFEQAKEQPKVEKVAFGYTYKYWESLLKNHLLEDLSALGCPIYSVNGVQDERVPIESVDALQASLEGKLTLKRLEGKGREIARDPKIYKDVISWLDNH